MHKFDYMIALAGGCLVGAGIAGVSFGTIAAGVFLVIAGFMGHK